MLHIVWSTLVHAWPMRYGQRHDLFMLYACGLRRVSIICVSEYTMLYAWLLTHRVDSTVLYRMHASTRGVLVQGVAITAFEFGTRVSYFGRAKGIVRFKETVSLGFFRFLK